MKHIEQQFNPLSWLVKSASVILAVLFFAILTAQSAFTPEISYQGKLTDSSGVAVADGDYNLKFKLCQDSACASVLWSETHEGADKVEISTGLFSVMLGSVNSLTAVDFNQPMYLEVQVGGSGVPSYETLLPRKILGAVPNAFNSQKFDGLATTSFLRSDSVNQSATISYLTSTNSTYLGSIVGLNNVYINNWSDLTSAGFSTTSADYWDTTKNRFTSANATTSFNALIIPYSTQAYNSSTFLSLATWFATSTQYLTSAVAASTYTTQASSTATYLAITTAANLYQTLTGDIKFSTTSADYWKTVNNFFSTTSADNWGLLKGYLTTDVTFSSTSADYWDTTKNRFTSANATTSFNALIISYSTQTYNSTTFGTYTYNSSTFATSSHGHAFAGDVTGTVDATVVGDDSHNHTASTISGLSVGDFSLADISQWNNDSGYMTTAYATSTYLTIASAASSYLTTTSIDYWKSVNNFYSTSSADYWFTTKALVGYSTTSADYWYALQNKNPFNQWLDTTSSPSFGTTTLSNLIVTNLTTSTFAGGLTMGGNLQVNGGNVGLAADTDLINLASGFLTVNGDMNISDGVISAITPASGYTSLIVTDNLIPLIYMEDTGGTTGQRVMRMDMDNGTYSLGFMSDNAGAWVKANAFTVNYLGNASFIGDLTVTGGDITLVDGGTAGIGGAKWTFDDTNDDISTTGNVGIGTSTPLSGLNIHSIGSAETLTFSRDQATLGGSQYLGKIDFWGNDISDGAKVRAGIGAITEDSSGRTTGLNFFTSATGGAATEQMRITAGGNVGIGMTAPATALDVLGTVSSTGLIVNGNSTTTNTSYLGTKTGLNGQYITAWSDLSSYLATSNLFNQWLGTTSTVAFVGVSSTYVTTTKLILRGATQDNSISVDGTGSIFLDAGGSNVTTGFFNVTNGYKVNGNQIINNTGIYSGVVSTTAVRTDNLTVNSNITAGGLTLSDLATPAGAFLAVSPTGSIIVTTTPSGASQWITSGSDIYYNLGDVGIGTSTPATTLVVQPSGTGAIINMGQLSGAPTFSGIAFTAVTSSPVTSANYSLLGEGTNTFLNAPAGGTLYSRIANATVMAMNSAGLSITGTLGLTTGQVTDGVGILSGNANSYTAYTLGRTAIEYYIGVADTNDVWMGGTVPGDIIHRTTAGKLMFDTNNGVGIPILTLARAGFGVGIGTTTPQQELVVNNSAGEADIIINSATSNDVNLRYAVNGTNKFNIYYDTSAGDLVFYDNAGVAERMRIASDGEIGIGKVVPQAKLDVLGTVSSTDLVVNGTADIFSNITAQGSANAFYNTATSQTTKFGRQASESFTIGVSDTNLSLTYLQDETSGSTHNYIFNHNSPNSGANNFLWQFLGVDKMVLTKAGYFGIGTSTPDSLLQVGNATANFKVDSSGNASTTGDFSVGANGITLKSTGYVGLGDSIVDNSTKGLDWHLPTPGEYGIFRTTGTWSSPNYQQLNIVFPTGIILNPGSAYGRSYVSVVGDQTISGYLGIGTTTPGAMLHVGNATSYTMASSGNVTTTGYLYVADEIKIATTSPYAYANKMTIYRQSGYGLVFTGTGADATIYDENTGAKLSAGGSWDNGSSRNIKENFVEVDNQDILNKIITLPMTRWNYIAESTTTVHLGPIAEDFYSAFQLNNPNTISTIDPAGVALVGIKALNEKLLLQQEQINLLVGSSTQSLDDSSVLAVDDTQTVNTNVLVVNQASTFYGTITVIGEASFESKVVFKNEVEFKNHLVVDKDTAGTAVIVAGATSTQVVFDKPYLLMPRIVANLSEGSEDVFATYKIIKKSTSSFTILMQNISTEDMSFDWIALSAASSGLVAGVSETAISGCTDASATNYNASATIDDGSCSYGSSGDSEAVVPDTSSTGEAISGCTDPSATNYNPDATADDGSCLSASVPTDDSAGTEPAAEVVPTEEPVDTATESAPAEIVAEPDPTTDTSPITDLLN